MGEREAFVQKEIQLSKESLQASHILHGKGLFRESIPKSYYTMFHMVKALFIAEDIESQKHSFIISEFSHRFIKLDKIFEQKCGRMLRKVFEYREMCDYKTMFEVDAEMSPYCLEEASEFIEEIGRYLLRD